MVKDNEILELDVLDKKILSELNNEVRLSLTSIAKKSRSSKEVVHYRIQRLLEKGIIKEFITIFGFGYWAYKIILQFQNIDSDEEQTVVEYLVNQPYTNFVTPCSGNWDMVLAVMAKNPVHLEQILREMMGHIGKYLHDYKVAVSVGGHTFGHTYLLKRVKESVSKRRNDPLQLDYDDKDAEIAKIIRNNARVKLTEINRKTGIPVDTIKYRLKKMEEKAIIKRYRLILDSSKLGYDRYEIFIRCPDLSEALIAKFLEYAKRNAHVEYLGRYVGSWDFTLTVHLKNSADLREFVLDMKKEFGKHIQNFESVTLFSTQKYTYLPEELR